MDETLEVIKKGNAVKLVKHINTADETQNIKFTHEGETGSIPFVDTLLERREDGTVTAEVYRTKGSQQPVPGFQFPPFPA